MSKYRPLNEEDALNLVKQMPDFFPPDAGLICREIGDGNLNLVFRIIDPRSNKSLIMKQALPYAKVVGESWPLTLDRARVESEALGIQSSLCPDLVPKVYLYDADLALTIMEDLSDHVIMRQGLIDGNAYPDFAEHIGEFLARTLFFTSDLGLNQQEKKERVKQFTNPELCKISEDLIFDHPYTNAETNDFNPAIRDAVESIWNDQELQLEVAILREKFLTHGQAMLHGDLHTGSIFVTASSTKVIDPEFAFYGPIGFDVGAVIANLLLNYAGQEAWSENVKAREEYRLYLVQTIQDVWSRFETHFRHLWKEDLKDRIFAAATDYEDFYMKKLLQDTVGYAGCKMIRRVIGLAHVADIAAITDPQVKERAERMTLSLGTSLIKRSRNCSSINEIVDVLSQYS